MFTILSFGLTAGFLLGPAILEFVCPEGEGARLEVDEPSVSNSRDTYRQIGQEVAEGPTVAVTLRNRGTATAWIEEARITIVELARLGTCINQGGGTGDVPRTHDYRITLPEFPGVGRRVIRRDLHVQVQPGDGVRPVLTFKKDHVFTENLYAIAVEFVADPGGRIFDAGRFVVGVPGPLERSGLSLPESEEVLRIGAKFPSDVVWTWCFRHNLAAMRRVLDEPGERSAEITALDHVQLAPGWNAYADRSATPLVVDELLGSEDPEAALYAIEAARQSGDLHLRATVRKRVVAMLLRQVHEELESYPPNAVESAERILSLGPSSAASRLLWRAKAAVSAEEDLLAVE